jgi:hypothetical protein
MASGGRSCVNERRNIQMDTDSQQHDLVKHVLDAGFPLKATSLIHLFVGGSQLHGAKVSGYDDLDIYGCYIEPPERILGVLPLETMCGLPVRPQKRTPQKT